MFGCAAASPARNDETATGPAIRSFVFSSPRGPSSMSGVRGGVAFAERRGGNGSHAPLVRFHVVPGRHRCRGDAEDSWRRGIAGGGGGEGGAAFRHRVMTRFLTRGWNI